jgi:hypothetical protein
MSGCIGAAGILADFAFEGELRMLFLGEIGGGVHGRDNGGVFLCGESLLGGSLGLC